MHCVGFRDRSLGFRVRRMQGPRIPGLQGDYEQNFERFLGPNVGQRNALNCLHLLVDHTSWTVKLTS